jgi:multidrug resistance protein, MATE family
MSNFTLKTDLSPLLKLVIPLVLSGIAHSFIFFFETIFYAHLSQQALAAGALVGWLGGTLTAILFGTLSSINVLISHKHGAKDQHAIPLILRDGLLLALLLAIPSFLLFWNIGHIFLLLGQHPTIVSLAKPYLHAMAWTALPTTIMIVFIEFLMGLGKVRIILFFDLLFVLITILASYVLIFGKLDLPAFGIAGGGWGMLVGYIIVVIVQLIYLLFHKRYKNYFYLISKFSKPSFLWELLRIGVPMGAMFCIEVTFFFVLTLFMGHLGTNVLAANQIVLQYFGVVMSIIFATAQAITVRMGHLLGAENVFAAKKAAYIGFLLSAIFAIIVAMCYWSFPKVLISIDFNINDPKNSSVVYYAKQLLAICAIYQLFEAIRLSLFGALRGLKDTHFALLISIISYWVIALPLGYLFSNYLQMGGAGYWWGMVIGAGCGVLLLYQRFKSKISQKWTFASRPE